METNQNLLSTELQVDSVASAHLKETARWAKFLAIVGLVLSFMLLLLGLFANVFMSSMYKGIQSVNPEADVMGRGVLTVMCFVGAAIYFFLSLFLLRFAGKMKQALLTTDQESFNVSLMNLKFVYRIMGIIVIIYLAFIALLFLIGIGTAMMK